MCKMFNEDKGGCSPECVITKKGFDEKPVVACVGQPRILIFLDALASLAFKLSLSE